LLSGIHYITLHYITLHYITLHYTYGSTVIRERRDKVCALRHI